jgi:hypothetical protein
MSGTIHRFYDSSPFSPSGRYLALTRLPYEDHLPLPGDVAEVVLVDLTTGENRVVAETRAWDTQLGAQVQWGADDRSLFFNDVNTLTWIPFGVRLDPISGLAKRLEGTIYSLSPDGKRAASPCLRRTSRTQAGYGVIVPSAAIPANRGASRTDGVYVTDTSIGKCSLLVSVADIIDRAAPRFEPARYADGDFYCFHVKWNPQGTRLMFILRWIPKSPGQRPRKNVITMDADGRNVHRVITDEQWERGGHHPNWCPDGDHVLMNLNLAGDGLRFVSVFWDGTRLCALNERLVGSGHPTMHADGRHLLTDAYFNDPISFGDGTAPVRWIDLKTSEEKLLVRVKLRPDFEGPRREYRVDAHPAWDRTFNRIAFNGCPTGKREVFVADMTALTRA